MSCSRCNCCQSPYDVLQRLGATRFLQAANASSPGLTDLLMHPGWTGTLLAPTDAAFDAALAQYRERLRTAARPAAALQHAAQARLCVQPMLRGARGFALHNS